MEENKTVLLEKAEENHSSEQKLKKTRDFLNELYKNVQMGKLAFECLLPRTKNGELKEELLRQYNDYERLSAEISGAIIELKSVPCSALGMAKPMLRNSIKMTLMFNSSSQKIADMVVQGDNQGIMDINRLINDTTGKVSDKAITLARKLLETEQAHLDKLKRFL